MATGPILETPRLRMTPFTERFVTARYLGWLNDPNVVRFSERRHRVHSEDTAREYLASFSGTPNCFWAIVSKDEECGHIGNITAQIDTHNSLADISILIGQLSSWGQGFGTEAWQAVMAYLLDDVGLRKITGGTLALNVGMLEIMRRSGMREDGRRHRHYIVEGEEVDVVHMAAFRRDGA